MRLKPASGQIMPKRFRLLDESYRLSSRGLWEIRDIQFGLETKWRLCAKLYREAQSARIIFPDFVSFRVQDEGEMARYWPSRDKEGVGVGTIYSIEESDYLKEFRGEVSGVIGGTIHYLICGVDNCLEVLSSVAPIVSAEA